MLVGGTAGRKSATRPVTIILAIIELSLHFECFSTLKSGGEASELITVTFKLSHIMTHGAGLEVTESSDNHRLLAIQKSEGRGHQSIIAGRKSYYVDDRWTCN
jgi:hypothetical protein